MSGRLDQPNSLCKVTSICLNASLHACKHALYYIHLNMHIILDYSVPNLVHRVCFCVTVCVCVWGGG